MPIQDKQLSSAQHAVPQNIMDVEFKLIGELTMRQFVYIVVFAIAAYMAHLSVPQPFTWPFVLVIGLTGLGLAFVPFEDRGLDEWIINFLTAINSPTERIWRKEIELPTAFAFEQNIRILQQELITLAPTASRRKLEEYLNKTQSSKKEDTLDIPEEEYIQKVREAFKGTSATEPKEEVYESKLESAPTKLKQKPATETREKQRDTFKPKKQKAEKQDKVSKMMQDRIKKSRLKPLDEGRSKSTSYLQPMTGHSGRKFVNLTPSQGKIILPIRGERVLSIEETKDNKEEKAQAKEDYKKKAEKLQDLIEKEKKNQRARKIEEKTEEKEEKEKSPPQKEEKVKKTSTESKQIFDGKLPSVEKEQPAKEDTIEKEEEKRELKRTFTPEFLERKSEKITQRDTPDNVRLIPSMVEKPNIISGIIKSKNDETLENAVLIIRNKNGEPVRALKTNKLGKFFISTPLSNGNYEIEIEKEGYSFDIIPVTINGGLLPSFEIKSQ